MGKMRMLSRVFATAAAPAALSAGALMFNNSTAYADDEACGENSGRRVNGHAFAGNVSAITRRSFDISEHRSGVSGSRWRIKQ
jgi:hypothetical protein